MLLKKYQFFYHSLFCYRYIVLICLYVCFPFDASINSQGKNIEANLGNDASINEMTGSSIPAFPGAEGGGAESMGGRGGIIIEVTNLNSDGPGSLRAACEASGPRTVVFRVAGIIDLKGNRITISNPYITIVGQTAPGGGITIKGHELRIQTHDVIVRYIRIRTGRGSYGTQSGDAIALGSSCYNVIIDHCSVSWSNDENIQIWSGNTPSHHVTFSWNIIAEGLTYNHASCGLIVGSDINSTGIYSISIHHNVFMHGNNRFPLVKCKDARIINNIMYNWNWWATGFGGGIKLDIIGNRYKTGPSTPSSARYEIEKLNSSSSPESGVPGDPSIYIKGNIGPSQSDPYGDNWCMLEPDENISRAYERQSPISGEVYPITINSVLTIEDLVLNDVGASKRLDEDGNWVSNRDAVDMRLVQEYLNGTGKIPVDENSVGGYPIINPGTPYQDSDHDGISDKWEITHGLNPNDASDGNGTDLSLAGYTNLEVFLNRIATDNQPQKDTYLPYTIGHNPEKSADAIPANTNIVVHVRDLGEGVDKASIVMTVNGSRVTPMITGSPADYTLNYDPVENFDLNQKIIVTINAQDLADPPNVMPQDCYFFSTYSLPAMISIEAESGVLTAPMQIGTDINAAGNGYIHVPDGSGNDGPGKAEYTINIPRTGDYIIWARVFAPDEGNNSFYISIDNNGEKLWDCLFDGLSSHWSWDQVSERGDGAFNKPQYDPAIFTITEGIHTLVIKQREDGTKLDKILLTTDRNYVPGELKGSIDVTPPSRPQGVTGKFIYP